MQIHNSSQFMKAWQPRQVGLVVYLTCLRHVCDLLKKCRRPGRKPDFKQVLSKIDIMEFGLNAAKTTQTYVLFKPSYVRRRA